MHRRRDYGPAGSPVPPGPLTPPPGMAPAGSGAPYATAVPPGGSASPYGGNAYASPYPDAPYAPPYGSSPTSQPSGGELSPPGQQAGQGPSQRRVLLPPCRPRTRTRCGSRWFLGSEPHPSVLRTCRIGRSCWTTEGGSPSRVSCCWVATRNRRPGEEDAQLIKIADETRTVSKSHLAVGVDAGGVYVVDRGSTNGSTVSTTNGMSSRCRAGEMVRVGDGAIVSIGDHWLEITRGALTARRDIVPACCSPTATSRPRSMPAASGSNRTPSTWCSRRASMSASIGTSGSSRTTDIRTSIPRRTSPS